MRKNLVGLFFFSSLGGNGSFLSIKDAVTCLQHHVGCNFIRTRNFCQLIFPCLGAGHCAVCVCGWQPFPVPRMVPCYPVGSGLAAEPWGLQG